MEFFKPWCLRFIRFHYQVISAANVKMKLADCPPIWITRRSWCWRKATWLWCLLREARQVFSGDSGKYAACALWDIKGTVLWVVTRNSCFSTFWSPDYLGFIWAMNVDGAWFESPAQYKTLPHGSTVFENWEPSFNLIYNDFATLPCQIWFWFKFFCFFFLLS